MSYLLLVKQIIDKAVEDNREELFKLVECEDSKDFGVLLRIGTCAARMFYEQVFGGLTIDMLGHNRFGTDVLTVEQYNDKVRYGKITLHDIAIENARDWGSLVLWRYVDSTSDFIDGFKNSPLSCSSYAGDTTDYLRCLSNCGRCQCCGTDLRLGLNLETLVIRPVSSWCGNKLVSPMVCSEMHGLPFQHKFNVPSGKIVFANVLHHVLGEDLEDQYRDEFMQSLPYAQTNINYSVGLRNYTLFYASKKMLRVQVGNSCPSVYYNCDSHVLTIRNERYDDEENIVVFPECGKKMGHIITDLWAVTAMDYDVFVEHCVANNFDVQDMLVDLGCFIVDVPSGEYTVTNYYDSIGFEEDGINGYATIILDQN